MIWHDVQCIFCGQPEEVDLFEFWPEEQNGGAFQLETCCEGLHESIIDEMNRDPKYGRELFDRIGATEQLAELAGSTKLRTIGGIDGGLRLDWNPTIREISQREAFDFVELHHAHNGRLPGWRFGAGIWNGLQLVGVVVVGNPTARALNGQCLEVRRLCLNRELPSAFVFNASSMAYGWAARETEKRGFNKIITYTLESEGGHSLKASGWTCEAKTAGGSWDRDARRREDKAPTCPKFRWSRGLRPVVRKERRSVVLPTARIACLAALKEAA